MDKIEVFHHYSSLLNNIIDNSEYYKMYFQNPHVVDDEPIGDSLLLTTGIHRVCLIDDYCNYVVKIPMDKEWNDCEKEIYLYNKAIEYEVEKFFAAPIFLGLYEKVVASYNFKEMEEKVFWCNRRDFFKKFNLIKESGKKERFIIQLPLYGYPRAHAYDFRFYSHKSECQAKKIYSPLKEYNLAIAASFIEDYGVKQYNKLTSFLYDYDINDIHFGNVGSINNRIHIIDYAG